MATIYRNGTPYIGFDGGTWGSIVGDISDQVDLKNALDGKQNTLIAGDGISLNDGVIGVNNTVAKTSQIPTAVSDLTNDSGYISAVTKNVTLASASWDSGVYTITDSDITATNTVLLTYPVTTSDADYTSLQAAKIRATGQSEGSLTLKALGTVPASDLTITLVVLR